MQEQQNNNYNNQTQDNYLSQVQQNSQIGRDANTHRRNVGLERKNNGSPKSSDSRQKPLSKNQRNIDNNEQNLRNAADVAIATNNPYGVAAGKAFKAADKITGGRSTKALAKAINTANKTSMAARLTQKALNRMNESGMGDKLGKAARAKNKFSGDKNISDGKKASDSSPNDNEQQQSEEIESNGGSIDLFAKIKKYKWPIIVAISFFSITFYLCIMMATIADGTAAAGAFSNEATNSGSENDWDKTAEDRINTDDENKTDNDVEGGIIEESYLTDNIPSSVKFVAKEKLFNSDDIADYYGVEIACGGKKSKKCTTGTEYKFYLKMYDIYFLYKNQYGVSLDLPLIMATLNYGNDQMPVVFKQNLNDYSRDDVKSDIYQGDLSWEFDYKNLAGYTYLNANDFRYDMQILAKNMVTKKISYKCGDAAKEAKDIETSKYSSELKCDSGTYNEDSVTETYELDLDKYDEFLLEYIEHKYFMKGSKVDKVESVPNSNSLADTMINLAKTELNNYKKGDEIKYQQFIGFSSGTPWCAAFVNYVASNSEYNGKKVSDIVNIHSASTGAYLNYFLSGANNVKFYYNDSCSYYKGKNGNSTYTPKEGDYMIYSNAASNCSASLTPGTCHDHIGIVEKTENGFVHTIEGNTGNYGYLKRNQFSMGDCHMVGFGSWY